MNRRRSKDEESGSDWDSMSEIGPAPPLKPEVQANGPPPQSLPPIQPKERTASQIGPKLEILPINEHPPFNFKGEVKSPSHAPEPLPKPGRQRKGRTYDLATPQKHVTFVGDEEGDQGQRFNGGGPDSDSEDPVYSTVKPKHRAKDNSHTRQPSLSEAENHEAITKPRKTARKTPKPTHKSLEGIDNHAYIVLEQLSTYYRD